MDLPPEKIYLQWNGDVSDGVTWCTDKINDDDVEYVMVKTKSVNIPDDLNYYGAHDRCGRCCELDSLEYQYDDLFEYIKTVSGQELYEAQKEMNQLDTKMRRIAMVQCFCKGA